MEGLNGQLRVSASESHLRRLERLTATSKGVAFLLLLRTGEQQPYALAWPLRVCYAGYIPTTNQRRNR